MVVARLSEEPKALVQLKEIPHKLKLYTLILVKRSYVKVPEFIGDENLWGIGTAC